MKAFKIEDFEAFEIYNFDVPNTVKIFDFDASKNEVFRMLRVRGPRKLKSFRGFWQ